MELRGTKSGASWSAPEEILKIFTEEYGRTVDILPHTGSVTYGHEEHIRHFVDVVSNGADPVFVPQQGVDMIKILEGFYQSAKEGREILL